MITGLVIFHVIVCILLVAVVLLQFGKGAETGAIMGSSGGGSQAIFTSSAKGNILTRATTILAILFLVNSIVLTTIKTKSAQRSILDDEAPIAAPLNSDEEDAAVTPENPVNTETAPTAVP